MRKRKKTKKIIILSILSLMIMITGYSAFNTNIRLSAKGNVYEIGREAFGANELTYINFPESLKRVWAGAFQSNNLVHIPNLDNLTFLDTGVFWGNSVEGDEAFVYGRNADGTINYTILNSYAGKWREVLNIPNTVKILPYYSLRYAKASTINLPEGLKIIRNQALMNTRATVNIPSTIESIESNAFSQTTGNITINIKRKENAIEGAPWGATNATVNWIGNN